MAKHCRIWPYIASNIAVRGPQEGPDADPNGRRRGRHRAASVGLAGQRCALAPDEILDASRIPTSPSSNDAQASRWQGEVEEQIVKQL